ncbi:hypothetical protein Vadar_006257 [Vaccinium darrowii]|uniref:Uncharacterized protein n=1 Tax=Vaccinium darrowii TaxID=229202 RepID=A0ACB7XG97_9ERIC|nr:hypothetical protein Vadar_006257 [Vaccinium darrowii]
MIHKNGNSHLSDHYKVCHRRKVADMKQKVLKSNFLEVERKKKLLESYNFDEDFVRGELACTIIMHEYPLSIVDHIGFRRIARAYQPLFTMGSRNAIKSDILGIYDVERVKTMKAIERNRGRVAVTASMWSASNQKRRCMVITIHFIDDSWKLQSRILRFVYLPRPYTAQVFYDVAEFFSGTRYPTANSFFAQICKIKFALSKWDSCENVVMQNMASKMAEKYDKYWENIHGILGVATVLDPRYKMSLIEFYFSRIFVIDSNLKIEAIRKLCYDLFTEYQGKLSKLGSESSSKVVSSFEDGDDLSLYDKFILSRKKTKIADVKSELDKYLEDDVFPCSPKFDILEWWKSCGLQYPTLKAIAKDVLAIPVSTVASEAAFRASGRVVNLNRNKLHPKTLEAVMSAQSWLTTLEREGEPAMRTQHFGTTNYDVEDDCVSRVRNADD